MSKVYGNDTLPPELKPEVTEKICQKLPILRVKMRAVPAKIQVDAGNFRKSVIFSYPSLLKFYKLVENCGLESLK